MDNNENKEIEKEEVKITEDDVKVIDKENQMFTPESDYDDEFESTGLLTGEKYNVPTDVDGFIDSDTGEVLKREDMTPWQIIKSIAKQNNVQVREPSKGCNHCYGRGYESIESDTKMPVPCRCIFRGRTPVEKQKEEYWDKSRMNQKVSRLQRRHMAKFLRSSFKKQRKDYIRKIQEGDQSESTTESEVKVPDVQEINKVLGEYIRLNSLQKTADSLKMTLTAVKKIVKSNREEIEKLKNKGE